MENSLLFLKIFLLFINYIYAKLNHLSLYSAFCLLTDVLEVVDIEICFLPCIKILLYCCGDIEINPDSKQSSQTFFHWNLNAIAAHEFIIFSLLQGYITKQRKIDWRKINSGVSIPYIYIQMT